MMDIDSRGWTGPAPEPAPADRHAAHAAFLAAGGPAAARPQRVAAAACWTGLVLLPFVVLLGADDRSWPPGLPAAGDAFRAMLDAWLVPSIGSKGVEGVVAVLGDPRVPALLLALAGSIAGMASAWQHRAALTRGFQAAGDALQTSRFGGTATLLLLLSTLRPVGGTLLALNALMLWFFARLTAEALTTLVKRIAAGAARRRWDWATLLASLGGLLLALAHVLHGLQ
ncbi:hypothetical protein [Roseomonas haemaphysalidis]|uniref:Yip1 domain-containing protein n=1 Tax=Roseomonas haemaphysalidis TaxID=2768162 RepID=A0ABS3KVV6_9PROT|nr:hypothetical protein [Roseomonas haemaphysalidis]MBO1081613.1 hypothetical protein [Roseomonas haemaphysalidis]